MARAVPRVPGFVPCNGAAASRPATSDADPASDQHIIRQHRTSNEYGASMFKAAGSTPHRNKKQHRSKAKQRVKADEIKFSDITILEMIGEGSFGQVYKGVLYGNDVAVKFLRLKHSGLAMQEFEQESRIMRKLRHPNIVEYLGAVYQPSNCCIITEYLPNGSLEDLLHNKRKDNKQLSIKRIIQYAKDICRALSWLHHKNVIHRDLKPANILLDGSGSLS